MDLPLLRERGEFAELIGRHRQVPGSCRVTSIVRSQALGGGTSSPRPSPTRAPGRARPRGLASCVHRWPSVWPAFTLGAGTALYPPRANIGPVDGPYLFASRREARRLSAPRPPGLCLLEVVSIPISHIWATESQAPRCCWQIWLRAPRRLLVEHVLGRVGCRCSAVGLAHRLRLT